MSTSQNVTAPKRDAGNRTSSIWFEYQSECHCSKTYPDGSETQVEGYDPDMLYRRWKHIEKGNTTFQKGAEPEDKELDVGVFLADIGHKIKYQKRSLSEKRADVFVDDVLREIKVPEGSGGTVGHLNAFNQFKSALGQSDKIIVSEHLIAEMLGDRNYESELKEFWLEWTTFTEVWFISRNGEVKKLKK